MTDKTLDRTYKLINEQTELLHILAIIYEKDEQLFDMIKRDIKFNFHVMM